MIKRLKYHCLSCLDIKIGNLKVGKTEFLEFVQIMPWVEYFCIFVQFLNDASCEFVCLVELRWRLLNCLCCDDYVEMN